MKEIKLGMKVKCIVSGFTGIATGRCVYLNGCVQYNVKPRQKEDGTSRDSKWIDIQQLKKVDNGVLPQLEKDAKENPIQLPQLNYDRKKKSVRLGGPQDSPKGIGRAKE